MTDQEKKDELFQIFSQKDHPAALNKQKEKLFKMFEVDTFPKLCEDFLYNSFYQKIGDYKKRVEEIQGNKEFQVAEALEFLQDSGKGNSENFTYALKLIEIHLMPLWDDKAKATFQAGKELVVEWVPFFFSYTNKSAPGVNNTYKNILLIDLPGPEFDKNKEDKNLLVKLMYNYFYLNKVNPFYDKEDIELGDEWKKKIFKFTKKSYALCQFVEMEMFGDKAEINYCYQEYISYKNSIKNFFELHGIKETQPETIFIIKNPENEPDFTFKPVGAMEKEIEDWIEEIKKKQFIKSIYQTMTNQELKNKIQDAASKIQKSRDAIFKEYLQNLKSPIKA